MEENNSLTKQQTLQPATEQNEITQIPGQYPAAFQPETQYPQQPYPQQYNEPTPPQQYGQPVPPPYPQQYGQPIPPQQYQQPVPPPYPQNYVQPIPPQQYQQPIPAYAQASVPAKKKKKKHIGATIFFSILIICIGLFPLIYIQFFDGTDFFSFGKSNGSIRTAANELSGEHHIDGLTIVDSVVVAYDGRSDKVEIPDGVVMINKAFCGFTELTSVTVPDSVLAVAENAFSGCPKLTVNYKGEKYRYDSELDDIEGLYYNLNYKIRYELLVLNETLLFCGMFVDSVEIPDYIERIGDYAFSSNISLTSLVIPGNVKEIGDGAFYFCGRLESVTMSKGVERIGDSAFYFCYNLTSLSLPDSLKSIGENAFYYCNDLVSLTVPGSVEEIGANAFNSCYKLTSVTVSDGVKKIGYEAFGFCSELTVVKLPDSVTDIDDTAFFLCSDDLTVRCSEGSYAQRYAEAHGIHCTVN